MDFSLIKVIECYKGVLRLLDQTELPNREIFLEFTTPIEVAGAITEMRIRGAPAIGVAAAYGFALTGSSRKRNVLESNFLEAYQALISSRPTAFNLKWSLDRMWMVLTKFSGCDNLSEVLLDEARAVHNETLESDIKLSSNGVHLIEHHSSVLTHCNTGALATAGYGTALGVIRMAHEMGRLKEVIVTETRPWLQGARLTMWELDKLGIPSTLIVDSAAAQIMKTGRVGVVMVGADRITSNGDVANKIGTYALSIISKEHGIPFYVAAPFSTIDMSMAKGQDIVIETRPAIEITHMGGLSTSLKTESVINLAFDVTPNQYITGIITERGIARPPYSQSLEALSRIE